MATQDLAALRADLLVTATVQMGKREVPITGLPLDAIVDISRRHWNDVNGLFGNLVSQVEADQDINLDMANWLGGAVLTALPQVAAEIITVCAGWSLEAAEIVRALPAPTQLDALDKIAALTFTSEMPPKKVIETVVRMLVGATKPLIASAA